MAAHKGIPTCTSWPQDDKIANKIIETTLALADKLSARGMKGIIGGADNLITKSDAPEGLEKYKKAPFVTEKNITPRDEGVMWQKRVIPLGHEPDGSPNR